MALLDDTDEVEEAGSGTTELAAVCLWDSLRCLKLCAVPIGGKFGCGYRWLFWYCCCPWLATLWSIFRTIGRNLADSVRIPENCKWYNSSSSYSLILFIWYGRSSSLNEPHWYKMLNHGQLVWEHRPLYKRSWITIDTAAAAFCTDKTFSFCRLRNLDILVI